uniref:alpha-(1,6)-fucosyltransferase-like isoform X2 n=1 Tax=Styela clava TaxID=7725 RepID=UPI00193A72EC|nr:alpha-(1,6)-fucosyltransferase-like isoform X2 [Styela clava]
MKRRSLGSFLNMSLQLFMDSWQNMLRKLKNKRRIILLFISVVMITASYHLMYSRRYSVSEQIKASTKLSRWKEQLLVPRMSKPCLRSFNESNQHGKKNRIKIIQSKFKKYWITISALFINQSGRNGNILQSLRDGYDTLVSQFDTVGRFLDGEQCETENKSEFKVLWNLLEDVKNYWLHITSSARKLDLPSTVHMNVNDGYIDLRKEIKEVMDESSGVARKNMKKLQTIVQDTIQKQQNPVDCKKAQLHVCNVRNIAGFGSELHSIIQCFLPAFEQQRTLIYRMEGWKYDSDGWSHIFAPLSGCDDFKIPLFSLYKSEIRRVIPPKLMFGLLDPVDFVVRGGPALAPGWTATSIPCEIANDLVENHGHPYVWWISQFVGYAMRMQSEHKKKIQNKLEETGFKHPIAGIHIRRGDKLELEASKHEVEEYMFFVEVWFDEQNIKQRRVYVATDDNSVLGELKNKYPKYEFIATPTDTNQEGVGGLEGILTDVHILSQCDFVACTGTSNICRLVYELLTFHHNDAPFRWQSVDCLYYLNGNEYPYVATSNYSGYGGMKLGEGEYLEIVRSAPSYVPDGLAYGEDLNNGESGSMPFYKIKPLDVCKKMPGFAMKNLSNIISDEKN